ncbi:hypothetical protein CesoFtcFv8_008224 [Champsocephalus esox]|uniref:C2H2 AKAP95-type domain-containing protein n=1 Tax=Champsocephalus esox TaxID=159716 RepID=A0AAN8H148_9TELE|nr:hypothetical protein CesoFtcFv8_008224 [Champsocephalus esox]
MDGRSYGSGYSSWGGGGSSSRGSGGFDLYGGGYKDSMSGLGGYGGGGGGGGGHMKRGLSGTSSTGTHADAVIAKINQRLDMLTQLEGGLKGSRGDRFDHYESFDSRSPALPPSRDLYRSSAGSYGYDGREDGMLLSQRGNSGFGGVVGLGGGGGGFDSPSSSSSASYGAGVGEGGGDSPPLRGGGRGKLPSLLASRMYPESGGFQQQDIPGRHFGGGPRAGRQRGRKRPLNKQVKPQREMQKKRKQTLTAGDEPESKMNRTEPGETKPEPDEKNGDDGETKAAVEVFKAPADADNASPEEKSPAGKQSPSPGQDKHPKMRKRRGFLERVMFACSVCKFRSFYKEEMETHLDSRFHKDHFKFLSGQLSKPTTDFLQEYLQNKFKKTDQRVGQLENHSAAICQVYREQDLTKDLGMEHFMRKVEAAHCAACDVFIPMQPHLIQKHIKSPDHNYNRKGMMEQSKRASLSVARSILNHKLIGKKLESYLKGENPFTGNQDDQDPEDSMAMDVSELELTGEGGGDQSEEGKGQEEEELLGEEEDKEAAAETAVGETTANTTTGEEEEEKMDAEEGQQGEEDEDGFEVEDEEEGYVVHDEAGEDEGVKVEEEEEEEKKEEEEEEKKEEEEEGKKEEEEEEKKEEEEEKKEEEEKEKKDE